MHAIAGAMPSSTHPALVQGLAFRHWLDYERCHVPVRLGRREAREYERCFQQSQRGRLQYELQEVFICSRKSLKRLMQVVELPAWLLRLHVAGDLTIDDLKRVCVLPPEMLEELQIGVERGSQARTLLREISGAREAQEALAERQHGSRDGRYCLARLIRALTRATREFDDPLIDLPRLQPAEESELRKGLGLILDLLADEQALDRLPDLRPTVPPRKKKRKPRTMIDPLTGRRVDPLTGAPSTRHAG